MLKPWFASEALAASGAIACGLGLGLLVRAARAASAGLFSRWCAAKVPGLDPVGATTALKVRAAALATIVWCAYDRELPAGGPREDPGPSRVVREVGPDPIFPPRTFSWFPQNMVLRKGNKIFLRTGLNIYVELLLVENLQGSNVNDSRWTTVDPDFRVQVADVSNKSAYSLKAASEVKYAPMTFLNQKHKESVEKVSFELVKKASQGVKACAEVRQARPRRVGWRARSTLPLLGLGGSVLATFLIWKGFGFGFAGVFLLWSLYSFFKVGAVVSGMLDTARARGSILDAVNEFMDDVLTMQGKWKFKVKWKLLQQFDVQAFRSSDRSIPSAEAEVSDRLQRRALLTMHFNKQEEAGERAGLE